MSAQQHAKTKKYGKECKKKCCASKARKFDKQIMIKMSVEGETTTAIVEKTEIIDGMKTVKADTISGSKEEVDAQLNALRD